MNLPVFQLMMRVSFFKKIKITSTSNVYTVQGKEEVSVESQVFVRPVHFNVSFDIFLQTMTVTFGDHLKSMMSDNQKLNYYFSVFVVRSRKLQLAFKHLNLTFSHGLVGNYLLLLDFRKCVFIQISNVRLFN